MRSTGASVPELTTRAGRPSRPGRVLTAALLVALGSVLLPPLATTANAAPPPNFQESIVLSGLSSPTAVRFAPDGRVFVAEKSGLIKVFSGLTDTQPTVFADLRAKVHDYWDRGLLGLVLDPAFPARPYVYVLYTHDAAIGGTAPTWSDACPTPPGPTTDGCLVSGRLSRLQASGDVMVGAEQVLIEAWCQQLPSHSVGDLEFGPDGALYVSGGDGASFGNVDYGQYGSFYAGDQANPCGDPPGSAGTALSPPTAEGGSLRSQSLRRVSGPAVLNGGVLRVDPDTGAALPSNPLAASPDPNARRIIAYGLRNPFRFTVRPGTDELWVGDVGWNTFEEIHRVGSAGDGTVENFGWPCYEGPGQQAGYRDANLNICSGLYAQPSLVSAPYYAYHHSAQVVPGETCPTGSSSITGMAFYQGGSYPTSYNGALFFADHSRNCIWVMSAGVSGIPDPAQISTFVSGAANPVDLQIGPGGDLFYVDHEGGTVRRIRYFGPNTPPVAVVDASPISGPAPLAVSFSGTRSSDPDPGDSIAAYSWDLDGDGAFGDSTLPSPTYTYTAAGSYTVGLSVTDTHGAVGTATTIITVANTPPVPTVTAPPATTTWKVADQIAFAGSASDQQDGTLPASALSWTLVLNHCITVSDCHAHQLQTWDGVASGSFNAPDHGYPAYLELRLTATDSGGLSATTSVRLDPETVDVTFAADPAGLQLSVNGETAAAPATRTVIVGSSNSVSAPSPQTAGGTTYVFSSWSDGGPQSHTVVAPAAAATYTARYAAVAVPTFRSQSTVVGTTVPRPAGVQAGDLLLSVLEVDGSAVSVSGPAGWTMVTDVPVAGGTSQAYRAQAWYKVATGSEPASYSWAVSGSYWTGIGVLAYGNVDTASPIETSAGRSVAGTTTPATDSITTVGPNAMIVASFVNYYYGTWSPGSGMAERFDFDSIMAQDAVQAAPGPTGPRTATHTTTGPMAALVLALKAKQVDQEPPVVSITEPAAGATVSGSAVTVSATAGDDVGVASVQFKLDGSSLGASVTSPPYQVTWNTELVANGAHTLTAVAADAAGNQTTSAPVSVTVSNAAPPPVISSVQATSITSSAATITWVTSTPSDTTVEYGTTAGYGSSASTPGLVTSHSQPLSGLTAGTLYHYRVLSRDVQGQLATSGDFTFTTEAAPGTPPAFRSASTTINGTTVAKPSGVVAGNLLLASMEVVGESADVTPPQGWTLLLDTAAAQGTASAFHAQVWYKVATASEPASYAWSVSGSPYVSIGLLAYTDVDTAQPIDASSGRYAGVTATPTTNAITTTTPSTRIVALFINYEFGNWTAGSGMTQRYDFDSLTAQDAVQAAAGSTGTKTASTWNDGPVAAQVLALRPK